MFSLGHYDNYPKKSNKELDITDERLKRFLQVN